MKQTETIAAIATGLSDSGIGIVRISGEDAIEVGNRIYRSKNGCHNLYDYGSHTIHYGYVVDGEEMLDEVMVSVMKAPNSYTREDTVEINCHGGILITMKILETVLKYGARPAQPGEFTKRAFLNGRIDLTEAEAVMDLIRSKNEYALKASVSQLKGSVSVPVRKMREEILHEIAFIESALDDPEHISTEGYPDILFPLVKKWTENCDRLIASADNGIMMKEGIRTVILGKPNVGKSSLLNLLAGEEKAIVTDIPGTTRDMLEEYIRLDGVNLHIIDTAGIRSTQDVVEQIGVDRAVRMVDQADLVLYMVDSSVPLDEDDERVFSMAGEKKGIILLNKSDLESVVTEEMLLSYLTSSFPVIKTSIKEGKGMEELSALIREMFYAGTIRANEETVITNVRHKEALAEARESLSMVERSLREGLPEDFYSIDLMSAYTFLGSILGEEVGDDLIDEIFSKFCMGK